MRLIFIGKGYLLGDSLFYLERGEIVSELAELLGNGRYVFYKSLAQSSTPFLKEVYSIGASRINNISVSLSGRNLNQELQDSSVEFQDFQNRITSYLNNLRDTAAIMRSNEIAYIQNVVAQFKKDTKHQLLKKNELKTLMNLSSQERVTAREYNDLIAALNKIKYAGKQKEEFSNTIKIQIKNISLAKNNLENAENKEEIIKSYEEAYNKYSSQFSRVVTKGKKITYQIGDKVLDEIVHQQQTELDKLARRINSTMAALNKDERLIEEIKKQYAQHIEDREFTIIKDQFISYIIDQIIEEVRKSPKQWSSTTAKKISENIIQKLSQDGDLRNLTSNSQASKITFQKKQQNDTEVLFKALAAGKKNIVDLLLKMDNMEEFIRTILPENGDKYIKELNELRDEIENLENKSNDTISKKRYNINKDIKGDFRSSELGKTLFQALSSNKNIDIHTILTAQTNKFLDLIKPQLKDFAIIVKKSSLAELMSSTKVKNDLGKVIFNDIGGSFNLKDDVIFAIRQTSIKAPTAKEIETDLKSTIDEINNAIEMTLGNYLKTYYERQENSQYTDRAGSANTAKAREDYEEAMKKLLDKLETIYNDLDKEGQKQLDEYAQQTDTFLGSISVKEYSLYQDTIGFHGGTLGNTSLKALENIQKMYDIGGISTLDMETLTLALINCSDAAIGGSVLRTSLENYLLGGAALMMFDEGYGQAIPFLGKMNDTIKKLLPRNLNLYQLNGAYIPASYVLETIYQNLKEFYEKEITNYTSDYIKRNKVVINNVPQQYAHGANIFDQFNDVANKVLSMTNIQFVFMAGMLDIFNNLAKAFNVK